MNFPNSTFDLPFTLGTGSETGVYQLSLVGLCTLPHLLGVLVFLAGSALQYQTHQKLAALRMNKQGAY